MTTGSDSNVMDLLAEMAADESPASSSEGAPVSGVWNDGGESPRPTQNTLTRLRAPRLDDHSLMQAAQEGDDVAFGVLVRRHQKRIHGLAMQMLRNAAEAEDVTQDTFVRAYRALARFDGRSQPFTWLYRIAINLSLNTIRSRKRNRGSTPIDDPNVETHLVEKNPMLADPSRRVESAELVTDLYDAIDALTETLRTTLILVVIDGLSHLEAASVLGCPEGTVAWRVHEARRKLRRSLSQSGHANEEVSP